MENGKGVYISHSPLIPSLSSKHETFFHQYQTDSVDSFSTLNVKVPNVVGDELVKHGNAPWGVDKLRHVEGFAMEKYFVRACICYRNQSYSKVTTQY